MVPCCVLAKKFKYLKERPTGVEGKQAMKFVFVWFGARSQEESLEAVCIWRDAVGLSSPA